MSSPHYLTEGSLAVAQLELNDLRNKKRAEVADRLRHAKEFGDYIENSEYADAREEQAVLEARIFVLEDLLQKATIIPKNEDCDVVRFGSVVLMQKGERRLQYT